jgi:hypothetical protein
VDIGRCADLAASVGSAGTALSTSRQARADGAGSTGTEYYNKAFEEGSTERRRAFCSGLLNSRRGFTLLGNPAQKKHFL